MKKTILFLVVSFFTSKQIFAQCNCGTGYDWKNSKIQISNQAPANYKCGYQIPVTCRDTIFFRDGGYTCANTNPFGGACKAKYKAAIKNYAGLVVETINSFSFGTQMILPRVGEKFTVEISAVCGKKICKPCIYTFNVTCPPVVACGCDVEGRWQPFSVQAESVPNRVLCNGTVYTQKDQRLIVEGGYKCSSSCVASLSAVLYNSETGALVESYPSFSLDWHTTFRVAGKYKLVITPTCNGKTCGSCVLFFVIS